MSNLKYSIAAAFILQLLIAYNAGETAYLAANRLKRVVHGTFVDSNEFPFQVSIRSSESKDHFCGGIIINGCFVLTAAHCVYGFEPEDFQVVAGTVDLKNPNEIHEVVDLKIDKLYDWNEAWTNDIALVKVNPSFRFDKYLQSAVLDEHTGLDEQSRAVIVGFGKTSENDYVSNKLRKTAINLTDIEYCNDKYASKVKLSKDRHLCGYSSSGNGMCKGDSGGPLLDYNSKQVIGISSVVHRGCFDGQFPMIFTRLSHYIDWIEKHGNWTRCYPPVKGP